MMCKRPAFRADSTADVRVEAIQRTETAKSSVGFLEPGRCFLPGSKDLLRHRSDAPETEQSIGFVDAERAPFLSSRECARRHLEDSHEVSLRDSSIASTVCQPGWKAARLLELTQ